MPRPWTHAELQLARGFREHGIFKVRKESKDGKGFRLKRHEQFPDDPLSPHYFDLRLLRSLPDLADHAVTVFQQMMEGVSMNRLADVPTAITPIVALLMRATRIPMISPREPKTHGTEGTIDGIYNVGDIAGLFDDVVTDAASKLAARRTLETKQLRVSHVFILVDREQGGMSQLRAAGLTAKSAFTFTELLEYYRDEQLIATSEYDDSMDYHRSVAPTKK